MEKSELLKLPIAKQVMFVMDGLEKQGIDVSTLNSQKIVLTYYHNFFGIDAETKMYEYFRLFTSGKVPAYESVTRAIRTARNSNPAWTKPTKEKKKQVKKAKIEIGY